MTKEELREEIMKLFSIHRFHDELFGDVFMAKMKMFCVITPELMESEDPMELAKFILSQARTSFDERMDETIRKLNELCPVEVKEGA